MLNRIEASNFKSFKHLDYKCAKMNLLTGLNGAGKSSFIGLLLMLRSLAKRKLAPSINVPLKELGVSGRFDNLKYCYASDYEAVAFRAHFSAKENFAWTEGELQGGCVSRIIEPDKSDPAIVGIYHPDIAVAFAKKIQKEEFRKVYSKITSEENAICSAFQNTWENVIYVDAFRRRPTDLYVGTGKYGSTAGATSEGGFDPEGNDVVEYLYKFGRIHKLDESNPMIFPGSSLLQRTENEEELFKTSPMAYFRDDPFWFDDNCQTSRRYSLLKDQIDAWLNIVSPGAKLLIDRVEIGDEEDFIAKVAFGDNDAIREFKPQNVGFGISYVLPVLATLLTARPTDIIIIENPEAHIHPKGQSKIGELIARAVAYGVQVFVETHSDHVINGIRVAVREGILKPGDVNIAFFERKEHLKDDAKDSDDTEIYSEVRNIKVDLNGSLSEYPEDFMDEWNNQLLELM